MPVSVGDKLGPYEILAPLGAGGMGEVYRARDTRLGREVALKTLPAELAGDASRRQRFELEARAVAALNHPNIVAIYDVGDSYIVTEFVDGPPLHGTKFGLRKTLDIARQIGAGLACAHDAGIVHRDLKPANILLTPEGRVKIVDFGLAKVTRAAVVETMTALTEPGLVMGTVGYMSPEQVRGAPVDHRSDIFSFGLILYEMLAGRRAFHGDTAVETMTAILKQDPPELPETVPAGVHQIVMHCLEKEPVNRFQSTHDLVFALESITTASGSQTQLAIRQPTHHWLRRAAGAALILAVATASWLLAKRTNRKMTPQFHQLTFRRGSISGARFAADGKTIIYSAAWDGKPTELFSTLESSPESRPLGLSNAHLAAISRTGEMALILSPRPFLWFFPEPGTLARAPVSGGSPREVAENIIFADWSPDGAQLAVVRTVPGGQVLEFPIGKRLYETAGQIVMPKISPTGDLVEFEDAPLPWDQSGSIAVVDAAGKKRVISKKFWGVSGLDWSPDGSEIWFIGWDSGMLGSLEAVDLRGHPRLDMHLPGFYGLMDITPDGRALLMHDSFVASMYFRPAGARQETDLYWHDNSQVRELSQNGSQILFSEGGAASTTDWVTFVRNTNGSPAVRLGEGWATAFSPDGKWAMLNPTGPQAPLVAIPTGAGTPRTLAADSIRHFAGRWLNNGQRIVFVGAEQGHRLRYYVQEPEHGGPRAISDENIAFDRSDEIVLSPDGTHVAALLVDKGIQLLPVNGGETRQVPGVTTGLTPVAWCRDGGLLAYHRGEIPAHILRIDLPSGKQRPWKELVPRDRVALTLLEPIRFNSDCETYAYTVQYDPSTLFVVSGLH